MSYGTDSFYNPLNDREETPTIINHTKRKNYGNMHVDKKLLPQILEELNLYYKECYELVSSNSPLLVLPMFDFMCKVSDDKVIWDLGKLASCDKKLLVALKVLIEKKLESQIK